MWVLKKLWGMGKELKKSGHVGVEIREKCRSRHYFDSWAY